MSDLIARLEELAEEYADAAAGEVFMDERGGAREMREASARAKAAKEALHAAFRDIARELAELRAQQPVAWIAVADRLPADLEDVLAYWAPSIPPSVANWNVDRRQWCDAFTHNEEDTEPTHWMPLPAKP